MNLLCFSSGICNKRIHTKNYFHTSISNTSQSGFPVYQIRHQAKTMKWAVLRIEIAASPEIYQNNLNKIVRKHLKLCESTLL